jgi:hypothetical protein
MPFFLRLSKQRLILLMIIGMLFFTVSIPQAQVKELPGDAAKNPEWLVVASTSAMIYEYDKNSIQQMDSSHIRIRIKETPKPVSYHQVKSDKMAEHRSLQDYHDRSHLVYDYEGYEKYAYVIKVEEIDGLQNRFDILETTDYDTDGAILDQKKTTGAEWITNVGAVPETALLQLFSKTKAIGFSTLRTQ